MSPGSHRDCPWCSGENGVCVGGGGGGGWGGAMEAEAMTEHPLTATEAAHAICMATRPPRRSGSITAVCTVYC